MKYDHFSMLPERAFQPRNGRTGMTLEGGGGGGGHTTSTVTQSNIPDWLRPQTEALLGAATQEYFNTEFNPETGQYDIVGTKPYRPFSEDKSAYFAPFSRQQQDVFSEAARMQTPGGFQTGQRMTGTAGMGALGTTQQALGFGTTGAGYGGMAAGLAPEAQLYGRTAADIGTMGLRAEELGRDVGEEARQYARQAAGMGGLYEQMATDPMSTQAYMSPYMQQVVERQKAAAIEDAQRANLGANLAAARQGTYGGARQAIAQGMRESALEKQLGDIQAQGLQTAFDQARQAQQFGVTTGLQGLQGAQAGLGTALQGGQLGLSGIGQAMAGQQAGLQGLGQAGQLYGQGMQGAQVGLQGVQGAQAGYGLAGQMGRQAADIGAAEQAANLARLGYQQELGGLQQAQQQQIINQAIQDYALAQEMPMQRLAGYSGLLRGYATPTTTVSQYQAAPTGLQQLSGLGMTAAGIGTIAGMGRKAGGVIKFAEGGITDVNALEGMAEDLSIPQLQQSMQSGTLPRYIGMPILENEVAKAERMKMAQMAMAQGQQQGIPSIADEIEAKANQLQGITAVAEPVMAAGGGMVAFVEGGLSLSDVMRRATPAEQREYQRTGVLPARLQGMLKGETMPPKGSGKAGIEAVLAEAEAGRGPNVSRNDGIRLTPLQAQLPSGKEFVIPAPPTPGVAPQNVAAPAAPAGPAMPPPPPAEEKKDMATLLAEREAQQKAFLGEDPSIKRLREALEKQGEESFLDRLMRGSQMVFAGEAQRTKGDIAPAQQVLAGEAARKQAELKRQEALAEVESADYRRKADIYKEVAGEERKKAETKEERAFQEKLMRLRADLTPQEFNNRLLDIAMGKKGTKKEQEFAKNLLESRAGNRGITENQAGNLRARGIANAQKKLMYDVRYMRAKTLEEKAKIQEIIEQEEINKLMPQGPSYDFSAADALVSGG